MSESATGVEDLVDKDEGVRMETRKRLETGSLLFTRLTSPWLNHFYKLLVHVGPHQTTEAKSLEQVPPADSTRSRKRSKRLHMDHRPHAIVVLLELFSLFLVMRKRKGTPFATLFPKIYWLIQIPILLASKIPICRVQLWAVILVSLRRRITIA